ncbi:hypothetical protein [Hymenobacter elongatus]|uniref:hypothetical protein n=1 Tax=Hymenobacter elongatus TaxID=877208 RepID=UPI001AEBE10A|nr:hypothetical protein [Hymenobacter elongatus]
MSKTCCASRPPPAHWPPSRPRAGGPATWTRPPVAWLVACVGQHADATLAELNQAWQAQGGRPVGQTCLWQALHEQHLRRKKKPPRH